MNPRMVRGCALRTGGVVLALTVAVVAQSSGAGDFAATLGPELFRSPVRANGDRHWASGPTYKVAFADGVSFFPVLGRAYAHSLPWCWRTASIRAGSVELFDPASERARRHADWRFAYASGPVIEAYDVRAGGVEQTFVLSAPLPAGDLVIEGRVDTELTAASTAPRHGPLQFTDRPGNPIVDYGAAFAIDADGRVSPMATSWDGSSIRLQLDGAWLAEASFPVVVDPLIGRSLLFQLTRDDFIRELSIARNADLGQLLVFGSRIVASGDCDAYAWVFTDDYSYLANVFQDVSADRSTHSVDCAYVGDPQKWILVMQVDRASPESSEVRYVAIDGSDRSLYRHADTSPLGVHPGMRSRLPSVGGTAAGSQGDLALVVYQTDPARTPANTTESDVWGVRVNCRSGVATAPFSLDLAGPSASLDVDREWPSVNPESDGGTSSWLVAWHQYDNGVSGDDWDVLVTRVTATGGRMPAQLIGASAASTMHCRIPRVAGRGGRYLVTYGQRLNTGRLSSEWSTAVAAQRLDWADSAPAPLLLAHRTLLGGTVQYRFGDIAFDANTRSHWCATAYTDTGAAHVVRLGFNAGVAESTRLSSRQHSYRAPAVTFDQDAHEFPFVYGGSGEFPPVWGDRLDYHQPASSLWGNGCGPASISAPVEPHAGHQFYAAELDGAPARAPAFLLVSLADRVFDLSPFGGAGCRVYVDLGPTFIASIGVAADRSGHASVPLPLPAPLTADLRVQFGYLASINRLGLGMTPGMLAQIR